jgi:hypothetical protein
MLGVAGWALTAVLPYPASHWCPSTNEDDYPAPAPVLPGHPERLDPSPPTDVERELWAAALSRPEGGR